MLASENRVPPSTDDPDVRGFHNYAPWINVVFGLSVFALRYLSPRGTFAVHWNLFFTGIVIMFAALATTISHGNTETNYWSAINIGAGIWLLISSKTVPSIPTVTFAQDILGALIIVVALVSVIVEIGEQRKMTQERGRTSPISGAPNR
jgi:hypothetical protein